MAQVIKVNFTKSTSDKDIKYKNKLIRIRDEIEDYLHQVSLYENDELAIALAAGRFSTMKLAQLTGENETRSFVNDCLKTILKNSKI